LLFNQAGHAGDELAQAGDVHCAGQAKKRYPQAYRNPCLSLCSNPLLEPAF
jgi:hypothetical protein